MTTRNDFARNEIDSIYVSPNDRFVVSLIVGYGDGDGVEDAKTAAKAALELTRDAGRGGTQWFVHDRQTGETHCFEQSELFRVRIS